MVTMAEGGLSVHLFNLRKLLNHRITVLAVTAVLAVYVLWQAGSLVWKVWLTNHDSSQSAAVISPFPKSAEPDSLQGLLRYPLIRSASEPAAGDSASIDAPKTSLNLKLVGLMYSTDKDQARAIIENQTDGARSYSTHERVAEKVEVYRIEPDRVILLHAGRQEALMLDPEDDTSSDQSGTDNQPTDDPNRNRASTESPSTTGQASANTAKKIADVMRDFSATPVMEEGQLVGFRLEALRNPELMNEWGIDPDDVITAVNGMPLNSQGRIMVLYDKLKKQKEFELTLINGGNSRTITVDLYE
jgi:general secretion pathway protein C